MRFLIRQFTSAAGSMATVTKTMARNSVEYKKLKYLCEKRGMKETELLLGSFFEKVGLSLNTEEYSALERFLQEPDPDIMNWLFKKVPLPENYCNESVVHKLKDYWSSGIRIPTNQF